MLYYLVLLISNATLVFQFELKISTKKNISKFENIISINFLPVCFKLFFSVINYDQKILINLLSNMST
ncbi:hypothetical protein BpHYR1_037003 [Brachionus plicatilis]|uniref:Uncharacterized protein n=1 Tax=Brachionus plicatilis TaxID=10195 RepID=A0A3M7SXD3_BRAPC|nr:hypothetical protein BpHYR1_037003 [Brachionus plicatilis]